MANTASKTRKASTTASKTTRTATKAAPVAVVNAYESSDLKAPKAVPTLEDAKKAYAAEGTSSATLARIVARLKASGTTVRTIAGALGVSVGSVSNWEKAGTLLDRIDCPTYHPTVRDGRAALSVGQLNAEKMAEAVAKFPALNPEPKRGTPKTGAALAEAVRACAEQKNGKRRAAAKKAATAPRPDSKTKDAPTPDAKPSKAAAVAAAGATNESRAAAALAILASITGGCNEEQSALITAEAARIAEAVAARIAAEVTPKRVKASRSAAVVKAEAEAARVKAEARAAESAQIEAERVAAIAAADAERKALAASA